MPGKDPISQRWKLKHLILHTNDLLYFLSFSFTIRIWIFKTFLNTVGGGIKLLDPLATNHSTNLLLPIEHLWIHILYLHLTEVFDIIFTSMAEVEAKVFITINQVTLTLSCNKGLLYGWLQLSVFWRDGTWVDKEEKHNCSKQDLILLIIHKKGILNSSMDTGRFSTKKLKAREFKVGCPPTN